MLISSYGILSEETRTDQTAQVNLLNKVSDFENIIEPIETQLDTYLVDNKNQLDSKTDVQSTNPQRIQIRSVVNDRKIDKTKRWRKFHKRRRNAKGNYLRPGLLGGFRRQYPSSSLLWNSNKYKNMLRKRRQKQFR